MQETNDEVRAEYYTEKTAISEVDSTLSNGGFTGYIELADNVLSGDYYQVYHAGQSMSVGFIGESSRLVDGDEAFETADDEVGIYQVRPADIEIIDLPEIEEPLEETDDTAADEAEPAEVDDTEERVDDETTEDHEPAVDAEDDVTTDDPGNDVTAANRDETATTETEEHESQERAEPTGATQGSATTGTTATQAVEEQTAAAASGESSPRGGGQTAEAKRRSDQQTEQAGSRGRSRSTEEPNLALETRAIPSLDPKKTAEPDESTNGARADSIEQTTEPQQSYPERSQTQQSTEQEPAGQPATRTADQTETEETTQHTDRDSAGSRADREAATDDSGGRTENESSHTKETTQAADPERIEELESEIADRDEEIERLESELDRKTTEYDDAKSQLETVREERDELATEVEQLREELERLETELGAATDAERRITPAEALTGTDIFPRYRSKGDATLEKAHDGSNRREDVLSNLQLEQNTQFDAEAVAVGGQEYSEFLESTLEYRFVNWVVGNLLFEIRETGHEKALKDLYDALPVIDWADMKGTVDVVYKEDGQETRSEESFDIVLRNRMGEPLLVANVNDSREGATQSMMENLVRAAERVGQTSDAFAGAFLVTRSFFEPPALETADDATKSGLLSRSKRKSFVNLSRKRGYHLCLVEARNENFTMLVPEL
ncbi:DUF7527 domain-containing protein [Halovenus salina]|uniref:DUF7527 domain-containing protein n=2 Tax=Halovenus salina TaxID=1510225 RepID=A0ABD5W297_9EURY